MSDVRRQVLGSIKEFQKPGSDVDLDSLDQDKSLIDLGVLDSLAFVNLVLALETSLNASVSLGDIDPFIHTSINGLTEFFS